MKMASNCSTPTEPNVLPRLIYTLYSFVIVVKTTITLALHVFDVSYNNLITDV